jgi:hypothetical protein
MSSGILNGLIATAVMVPINWALVVIWLWGSKKLEGEVSQWQRGFAWGFLLWAPLGNGLWKAGTQLAGWPY